MKAPDFDPNRFALPPPPLPSMSDDLCSGNLDWMNNRAGGGPDGNNGEGFMFNQGGEPPPPPPPLDHMWNMPPMHQQGEGGAPWNFSPMGMPPHMSGPPMDDPQMMLGGPPQMGGPALLPTPPRGPMGQQRQYPPPLMGTRRPQQGQPMNFNSPMNNFRPRGPRGSPGGPMRGSPFFRGSPQRGGNFRGNFRGARGRW